MEVGRGFRAEEGAPDANAVAVLSHRLWRQRFGADPDLIGSELSLSGRNYTVVGVLSAHAHFDRAAAQIFVPLAIDAERASRSQHYLEVYARLAPGTSLSEAQQQMNAIAATIAEQYPSTNRDWGVHIDRYRDSVVTGGLRRTLLVLFGAVSLLLLLACVNVANLAMVRAADRRREVSLRAVLGASRLRLLRQFLVESLAVALLGGALGVAFGYTLLQLVVAGMPMLTIPTDVQVHVDERFLLFALAASLSSGIIFGTAPALRSGRRGPGAALREGARGSSQTRRRRGIGSTLMVVETALALVLVIGSGLLVHSLIRLRSVDVGIEADRVLTLGIELPHSKYPDGARAHAFFQEALQRIEGLPVSCAPAPPRRCRYSAGRTDRCFTSEPDLHRIRR